MPLRSYAVFARLNAVDCSVGSLCSFDVYFNLAVDMSEFSLAFVDSSRASI